MTGPTFTEEDKAFLRSILDVPEDRYPWLVYADWLDDRGDPRAEYLRLSVERDGLPDGDPAREPLDARLAELWVSLDPTWLMIFDVPRIGNCLFAFGDTSPCPGSWDRLTATDTLDIRLCGGCRRAVHYCLTVEEGRQFADLGVRVAVSSRAFPPDRTPFEPPAEEPPEVALDDWEVYEGDQSDEPHDWEPPPPATRSEVRPWWRFW